MNVALRAGDRLLLTGPARATSLRRVGAHRFVAEGLPVEVEFLVEGGRAVGLLLTQAGMTQRLTRKPTR